MDEYVIAAVPPEKTVAFCIIEPLHDALVLCHVFALLLPSWPEFCLFFTGR